MKQITQTQYDDRRQGVTITIGTDPRYRGSVEALRTHPLYASLRPGPRRFLDAFLTNGNDKIAATHAAGRYQSINSARCAADRFLRSWKIKYLLEEFQGTPHLENNSPVSKREWEFLISQRLRSGEVNDATFADLTYQMALVKGWVKVDPKKTRQKRAEQGALAITRAEKVDEIEEEEPDAAPGEVDWARIRAMEAKG